MIKPTMDIEWERRLSSSRRMGPDGRPGAELPPLVRGGQGRPDPDVDQGWSLVGLVLAAFSGAATMVVLLKGLPAIRGWLGAAMQ